MLTRNAFDRVVADPLKCSQVERVALLQRLAAELQAEGPIDRQWLGRCLTKWLQGDGDLVHLLGLRQRRGSKLTAQRVVKLEQQARLLVQLSAVAGSDASALRVLTGQVPCPARARDLVNALHGLCAPRSIAAFSRARGRLARHGR